MRDLGYSIFLDPADAVRAWEARGELKTTVRWSEMMHEQHAVAFTVAKVARLDLLRYMQSSLDNVIRFGGTFEGWKANLVPELQKAGWWGRVKNPALTGTEEPIIVGERRLRTIYDTNTRMSLAAGHWQRIQRQKKQYPYLRYLPSTSEHKRPLHKEWYGVILPVDHPWWQTHFPPNGWGCKCHFEQVSEARMRRKGWRVTPDNEIPDGPPRLFTPAGGDPIMVPADIDPGFSYNPGTALLRAVADKATRSLAQATDAGMTIAAQATLRQIVDDVAFDQFIALPQGSFPVALLDQAEMDRIGAKGSVVTLEPGIYAKQQRSHPELTINDYRLLPDVIRDAAVIVEQGDTKVIFMAARSTTGRNRWWKAVIRQDNDHATPVVISYQAADDRELRREARKGSIILDNRE